MSEVRLTVEKEDRREALAAEEGDGLQIERATEDDAEEERRERPQQRAPQDHFPSSRSMNCATCESVRRSSTKRIAVFGMRTYGRGWWSSAPRRMSRDSGVCPSSTVGCVAM